LFEFILVNFLDFIFLLLIICEFFYEIFIIFLWIFCFEGILNHFIFHLNCYIRVVIIQFFLFLFGFILTSNINFYLHFIRSFIFNYIMIVNFVFDFYFIVSFISNLSFIFDFILIINFIDKFIVNLLLFSLFILVFILIFYFN
jgi:hypothetical protein